MPTLEELAKAVREQRSQLLSEGLKETLPKTLLLGGALGMGGAGLLGLANVARRNLTNPPRTAYSFASPVLSDIPYPAGKKEKRSEADPRPSGPVPQGPLPKAPSPPKPPKPVHKRAGLLDEAGRVLGGEYATDLTSHPLGLPAIGLGTLGGLYGGSKLMNWLLKQQTKKTREDELSHARSDYEEALLQQQMGKRADHEKTAAEKLGGELDRLADEFEKLGFKTELGTALGAYLLLGGLGAGAVGSGVYDYFRKRQPAAIVEKARKQHRRELASMRPASIYARPVPILRGTPAPGATEMAGDVLDESSEE